MLNISHHILLKLVAIAEMVKKSIPFHQLSLAEILAAQPQVSTDLAVEEVELSEEIQGKTVQDLSELDPSKAVKLFCKNLYALLRTQYGVVSVPVKKEWEQIQHRVETYMNHLQIAVSGLNDTDHTKAFSQALSLKMIASADLPKAIEENDIKPLTTYYLFLMSELVQTAFEDIFPYDRSAPLAARGETSVAGHNETVFTAHPCDARTHELIEQLGAAKVAAKTYQPNGEIGDQHQQSALIEALERLATTCPIKQKPSVPHETEMGIRLGQQLFDAVPLVEWEQGLAPGGLHFSLGSWIGCEADRNEVTPQLFYRTAARYAQAACNNYQKELSHVDLKLRSLASTHPDVDAQFTSDLATLTKSRAVIEKLATSTGAALNKAKTIACIEIMRALYLDPEGVEAGRYPSIKSNLGQFFPDGLDITSQINRARLYIGDLSQSVHPDLKDLITACKGSFGISSIQNALKKAFTPLSTLESLQSNLRSSLIQDLTLPLETLTELSHACKSLREHKSLAEDKDLQFALFQVESQLVTFGIHFASGQGRIDSREMHDCAAVLFQKTQQVPLGDKVKEGTPAPVAAARARQLISAIEKRYGNPPVDESLLNELGTSEEDRVAELTARKTADFFRTAGDLTQANPHYDKILIIANDEGATDYLEAFFIAVETGLIQFDAEGNVTRADIVLMPLKESVPDHDAAAGEFAKLWSIPMVRRYLMSTQVAPYMKAYSDTGRGDGQPGALSRLLVTPGEVHANFQSNFSHKFEVWTEIDHFGLFCEEVGYAEKWAHLIAHPPIDIPSLVSAEDRGSTPTAARRQSAETMPDFRVHHGVGSHSLREGGPGIDRALNRARALFEREGAWQTLQPGWMGDALQNGDTAATYLHYMSSITQPNAEAMSVEGALIHSSDATGGQPFGQWFKTFTDVSIESFHTDVVAHPSPLNKFLVQSPVSWLAANIFKFGSRAGAWKDLGAEDYSFTSKNRAITSAETWELLGGDLHVLVALQAIFKENEGNMQNLQTLFKENVLFSLFIHKMSEHLFKINFDQVGLFMNDDMVEGGDTMLAGFKEQYETLREWLIEITGQDPKKGALLSHFPQIRRDLALEKRTRYESALMMKKSLEHYSPQSEKEHPISLRKYAGANWHKLLAEDLQSLEDQASKQQADLLRITKALEGERTKLDELKQGADRRSAELTIHRLELKAAEHKLSMSEKMKERNELEAKAMLFVAALRRRLG